MTVFYILLAIVAFLFLSSLIASLIVFLKVFSRAKVRASFTNPAFSDYIEGMENGARFFKNLKPTEVSLTSHDNLKLFGNFYEAKNSKGTIILVHGYHGEGLYDCSMMFCYYAEKGYSMLVPDLRAHGKSEGKFLTFGIKESDDMLLWTNFIAEKFPGRPIILHGVSMGGATVGMMSDMALPKEVKGIVNDCGFTSPDEITSHVRKINHCPFFPFQLFIRMFAKMFLKVSLKEKNASESYARSTIPALFIHGEKDNFVPLSMGIKNYESSISKNKKLVIAKGAGHALSFLACKNETEKALDEFIDECVK